MSTPDTFEQQVQQTLETVKTDEHGKLQFDDGTSEELKYAVRMTKRHRDTQSSLTKTTQRTKALEAENEKLAQSWEQDAVLNLSDSEQARLEELKSQDPDAWRTEITQIEENKKTEFKTKREGISKEVSQLTELEQREHLLEEFNTQNPDVAITDDVIANDIPPRITNKLANGDITFADFLNEVKSYLGKGKRIAPGEKATEEPGFQKAPGTAAPSEEAARRQSSNDYHNEIF